MTITYRDGTPADAETIATLFERCFIETFGALYRPEDLADFLASRNPDRFACELADPNFSFRLAEDDGQLAGYLLLAPPKLPVETPPDTIELNQLYVMKLWHGSGVAAALMEWAIEAARESGARHIQLSVYIENHRARRFYERYGFHEVGRFDFMVGSHADEELVLRHVVLDRDT
jgi:ribosomal protein S18 acetylase RimI-like enzyme